MDAGSHTRSSASARAVKGAMLTGSIVGPGSQYVIGLKAAGIARAGDVLAEAQEQATAKEGVLKVLDAAAVSLRSKLGESLWHRAGIRHSARGCYHAVARSTESLQSGGKDTLCERRHRRTTLLAQRKSRMTLNFASAYLYPAATYSNLTESGLAAGVWPQGRMSVEKVSERERFSVEGFYYFNVTWRAGEGGGTPGTTGRPYPRNSLAYQNLESFPLTQTVSIERPGSVASRTE